MPFRVTIRVTLFLFLLVPALARARDYVVAPNGIGSTCTDSSPCPESFAWGVQRSGDTLIYKPGNYSRSRKTTTSGVTYRAEKPGTVTWSSSAGDVVTVNHSNITLRGLVFDGGGNRNCLQVGMGMTQDISGITIAGNTIKNCYAAGIGVATQNESKTVSRLVIRNNTIDTTGRGNIGEGFYIGHYVGKGGAGMVRDVQIYGNTVSSFTCDAVDLKYNVDGAEVHHNVFRRQVTGSGKCGPDAQDPETSIAAAGTNLNIYDNVFKDVSYQGIGPIRINSHGGNRVRNNVFQDINNKSSGIRSTTGDGARSTGVTTQVQGNLFCNVAKTGMQVEGSARPVQMSDNQTNASSDQCNQAAARIMAAMGDTPPDQPPLEQPPSQQVFVAPTNLRIVEIQ